MKKILSLALVVLTILSFVGCGKEQVPDVAVKDIITSIEEKVEMNGLTEVNLTSEEMSEMEKMIAQGFEIKAEDLEEGIIKVPMINLQVEQVIVLKAKDESKVEELKGALEKHIEKQVKAFENYVPKNAEIVKNNILKTKGKYILLAISENAEKMEEAFDKAFEQ